MFKNIVFDFHGVILNREATELDEEILKTISSLKEKGYSLHIFTNTKLDFLHKIDEKKPFLHLFESIVSCIDFLKPNEEAFKALIQSLGCNPREILLIDDTQENIAVAKEFGIMGILFTNKKELEIKLNNLLNDN